MVVSEPVSHPLAIATAAAHPWDDCVRSSEAEGEALDARVSALASFTEPSAEARAELVALARAIGAAVTREEGGGRTARLYGWWRSSLGTIRQHAARLGYDAEALDVRGPAWR